MERVDFVLGHSRVFAVLFLFIYGIAIFILIRVPLPIFIKILSIFIVLLHGWNVWILHIKCMNRRSVIKIWQDTKGCWGRETRQGHRQIGDLAGDSFVGNWLLVLRFRFKKRIECVVIPRDALSLREYQLLYSRLRFFTSIGKKSDLL